MNMSKFVEWMNKFEWINKFLNEMEEIYLQKGWAKNEVHFSFNDLQSNLEMLYAEKAETCPFCGQNIIRCTCAINKENVKESSSVKWYLNRLYLLSDEQIAHIKYVEKMWSRKNREEKRK